MTNTNKSCLNLYFAWMVALISMLITLYGSEFLGYEVCNLCWYQRICMYPLVVILGVALYRGDRNILPYALPFTVIGFMFAAYQYAEQMFPDYFPIQFCGTGPDCKSISFIWFGFITYPFLSMAAFIMISIALLVNRD